VLGEHAPRRFHDALPGLAHSSLPFVSALLIGSGKSDAYRFALGKMTPRSNDASLLFCDALRFF
jgi:hypothetical protein